MSFSHSKKRPDRRFTENVEQNHAKRNCLSHIETTSVCLVSGSQDWEDNFAQGGGSKYKHCNAPQRWQNLHCRHEQCMAIACKIAG